MAKPDFTKKYIAETFIEMVATTAYGDVTVQGIVERCKINRKTFYYHFFNKADLATYVFRLELALALNNKLPKDWLLKDSGVEDDKYRELPFYYIGDPETRCSEFLRVFSTCIKSNGEFYRKLFNSPDWGYFYSYVFEIYRPQLERDLLYLFAKNDITPLEEELDYLAAYFTNGSVIWVLHRRIMKRGNYSELTKNNLSTIVSDSMRGVVETQCSRLRSGN